MTNKVLICTPLYPPDIGGPAKYAQNLFKQFKRFGHEVVLLDYKTEKKLPTGIRHCLYFLRAVLRMRKMNVIIALDSFSVGLPAVCAAKIFRKNIILRLGGDFLWENYVEGTGNPITLKDFYKKRPSLSLKHKIIFKLTGFVLRNAIVVFSTEWQRDIFKKHYDLDEKKLFIVENFYAQKTLTDIPKKKIFLWAGRRMVLKNVNLLEEAFREAKKEKEDIILEADTGWLQEELFEKMKDCYAMILPSLSEVSPNVILEAISFNKPFILTKETGFYDKLKDVGVFVDPFDKEDIKNKLLFLADEDNYREYKKRVENFSFTHSWREIANEFLEVYKKTCEF